MKQPDLESLVNLTLLLEYEERFNIIRIVNMITATIALVIGIACFTLFDSTQIRYQLFGSAAFALFIRMVMGSPIERRLTLASRKKLEQWTREHESTQDNMEN